MIVFAALTAAGLALMGYLVIAMATHNQLFMERIEFMEEIGGRKM